MSTLKCHHIDVYKEPLNVVIQYFYTIEHAVENIAFHSLIDLCNSIISASYENRTIV